MLKKMGFAALVTTFILCTPLWAATATTLSYENEDAGVKMSYPSDWIKSEKMTSALVAFGVPKEKANLQMVENVMFSVQDLPSDIATIEDYSRVYAKQREQDPKAPVLVEQRAVKLGGLPAQKIVCTAVQNGIEIKFMQVWTVKNARAYLFSYGASKATYDNFAKDAERIMASMVFI